MLSPADDLPPGATMLQESPAATSFAPETASNSDRV